MVAEAVGEAAAVAVEAAESSTRHVSDLVDRRAKCRNRVEPGL